MRCRKILLTFAFIFLALVVLLVISSKCSAKSNTESSAVNCSITDNIPITENANKMVFPSRDELNVLPIKSEKDLSIKDIEMSSQQPMHDEIIILKVNIENTGSAYVRNIATGFYVDNIETGTQRQRFSLGKDGTQSATAVFSWKAESGIHTLTFIVDPKNEIPESDESNNNHMVTVTVSDQQYIAPPVTSVPISPVTTNTVIVTSVTAISVMLLLAIALDRYKFYGLFLPLYVKLKRKKILDQFTRGRIYGYLEAHPGAHYSMIKSALELNNSTLAYHLRTLEREEYIKSGKEGKLRCFYPYSAKIQNKNGLSAMQNKILEIVSNRPGITQKELIATVGASQQVVNYNVNSLKKLGLVEIERNGKETYLFSSTYAAN